MVVLAQTMVLLEAVAVAHLPLALMVLEVELVAMAVMELHHLYLAHLSPMRVGVVAQVIQPKVLEELVEAVLVLIRQPQHLEQLILEVVAVAVLAVMQAVLAVLASSSFHTQAQHNYLVVELLPNQAVTSFTHLHLLAHLALCHL
jgi:hypothetical protein